MKAGKFIRNRHRHYVKACRDAGRAPESLKEWAEYELEEDTGNAEAIKIWRINKRSC